MAGGRRRGYLRDVWFALTDVNLSIEMGLCSCSDRSQPANGLTFVQAAELASCLGEFARALIGRELLYLLTFEAVPPSVFAATTSDQPTKEHAINHLGVLFDALVAFDKQSLEDPTLASFLRSLMWPTSCWVREVLLSVKECRCQHLPTDIEDEIAKSIRRFVSVTIEDMMHSSRSQSKQHKS